MAKARTCTECGKSLEGRGPGAKTCSLSCRQKRSRRMRRQERTEAQITSQPGGASVNELVSNEHYDLVKKILSEELRPLVREAIDEEVLRAIHGMVALTPQAVLALTEDLLSEDRVLRQRAYSLALKYTMGNPAVTPPREDAHAPLEVNFNLPRPAERGVTAPEELEPAPYPIAVLQEAEVECETKVCDVCGEEKCLSEFVAGSDRCATCLADRKALVMERLQSKHAVQESEAAREVLRDPQPAQVHPGVRVSDAQRQEAAGKSEADRPAPFAGPDPRRFSYGQ